MALYRVRPGFVHGQFGQYKAGDTMEYTPEEVAGFADKLELVEVAPVPTVELPAETPAEVTPVVEPVPLFDVTGSTVAAVLAAVNGGLISAGSALAVETVNRNRATLVKALMELLTNGPVSE